MHLSMSAERDLACAEEIGGTSANMRSAILNLSPGPRPAEGVVGGEGVVGTSLLMGGCRVG